MDRNSETLEPNCFLRNFGNWLRTTVWVLPKAGIFSTKVQSKNESLNLHKSSIEAVQPRFWQYLVSGSTYYSTFHLIVSQGHQNYISKCLHLLLVVCHNFSYSFLISSLSFQLNYLNIR